MFQNALLIKQQQTALIEHYYLKPFKSGMDCSFIAVEGMEKWKWRGINSVLTPLAQRPRYKDTMYVHWILTCGKNPTQADISGK